MNSDVDHFLESVPLFAGLGSAAISDLLTTAREIRFAPGERLMRQGEPADGMYILRNGTAGVTVRVPGDEEVRLKSRGPGSVLGEISLLDRGTRSATVTALSPIDGFFIDARRFELLRADLSPSAFSFMNRLYCEVCGKIRQQTMWISSAPVEENMRSRAPALDIDDSVGNSHFVGLDYRELNLEQLQKLPLFARLNDSAREHFLQMARCRSYKRGVVLFKQGEDVRKFYIVIRGALRQSVNRAGLREQLFISGPGKISGIIGLIDGGGHFTSCDVREDALVLELEAAVIQELCKGFDALAYHLMGCINRALAEQLRLASGHVARLATEAVERHSANVAKDSSLRLWERNDV